MTAEEFADGLIRMNRIIANYGEPMWNNEDEETAFKREYNELTGAEHYDVWRWMQREDIAPGEIIDVISLGYKEEDIKALMRLERPRTVLDTIIKYRVKRISVEEHKDRTPSDASM